MSKCWSSLVLMVAIASFLFTACSKKFSSDNPLPVSYYPSVIINSDNNVVFALNPSNGQKNWSFSLPNNDSGTTGAPFKPSAIVYHERVYLTAANSDTVYKLNSETGALIAKLTVGPHSTVSPPAHFFTIIGTPIADAGMLYLATTNDTLYAIDTGTGATKWKFGAADQSAFYASPMIYNSNIYVATIGANPSAGMGGHIYCINKTSGPDASGNPIWDYPGLDSVSYASFISSPTIGNPNLYIGSISDSDMYCVNINPATVAGVVPTPNPIRWQFKAGNIIESSPTCYGGFLFFGCDDFCVYSLDTDQSIILTGKPNWKYTTGGPVRSSPIINNQVVYVGSYDYYLYALKVININGSQLNWKYKTKGLIKSSPLPYNGYVYVASYDNYIYAVDSTFGSLKWSYYVSGNIECSPVIDDLSNNNQNNSGISGYTY